MAETQLTLGACYLGRLHATGKQFPFGAHHIQVKGDHLSHGPSYRGLQFLGFLDDFVDTANHVERLLGQIVILAFQDALETANGLFQRHVLT